MGREREFPVELEARKENNAIVVIYTRRNICARKTDQLSSSYKYAFLCLIITSIPDSQNKQKLLAFSASVRFVFGLFFFLLLKVHTIQSS